MDLNEKMIELLQEIRDNQRIQITAAKKMQAIYVKIVITVSVLLTLNYLMYYIKN